MASNVRTRRRADWGCVAFKALFLLPALAFLGLYMYYPIEETFRLSLMNATGLGNAFYIGLQNYHRLLANDEFRAGLVHVFTWAFWSVVVQIPLAFFIAYSLSVYRNRVARPLRAIYYLANVLPTAVTAMLGRFIFAPAHGVLATVSERLNWRWLAEIDFLGDPRVAFWSVFAMATWAYSGFYIIYLMANIEQIPTEIREAAELDGASKWQYARFVVLPMITYPIRIVAILATVGSLKLFDLPYMLTAGGPGNATVTLGIILYKRGFVNWQYGKAAAVGVIIFVLSLAFTIVQFSLQRKEARTA